VRGEVLMSQWQSKNRFEAILSAEKADCPINRTL
jgi:hypothetical protein